MSKPIAREMDIERLSVILVESIKYVSTKLEGCNDIEVCYILTNLMFHIQLVGMGKMRVGEAFKILEDMELYNE